jgi:hypothetical protein
VRLICNRLFTHRRESFDDQCGKMERKRDDQALAKNNGSYLPGGHVVLDPARANTNELRFTQRRITAKKVRDFWIKQAVADQMRSFFHIP